MRVRLTQNVHRGGDIIAAESVVDGDDSWCAQLVERGLAVHETAPATTARAPAVVDAPQPAVAEAIVEEVAAVVPLPPQPTPPEPPPTPSRRRGHR